MKLPDGPKTPHWLQKIQYITDPLGYLDSAYQRYGDIFTLPMTRGEDKELMVLISNPQGIQWIFDGTIRWCAHGCKGEASSKSASSGDEF